jgi:hypothetical protein
MISWNGKDPHRVGVEASLLPSLNGDDCLSRFDDLELERALQTKAMNVISSTFLKHEEYLPDPIVNVCLPLARGHPTRFGIPEWIAATVQVNLTSGLLIPRDCEIGIRGNA